jgi:hypothetical protein
MGRSFGFAPMPSNSDFDALDLSTDTHKEATTMQIRQSTLTQFGDSLVRFMRTAGETDPDVKCSLDYMHSSYQGKKALTLMSPETGGMVLITHEGPLANFGLVVTAARIMPGDSQCWKGTILEEDLGIRGKQSLALWLINVFKHLSYLDTEEQFTGKMAQLQKDAVDLDLKSIVGGTLTTFHYKQYDI